MVYMVTFTINIPQMLAYIPYMDPMGNIKQIETNVQWLNALIVRLTTNIDTDYNADLWTHVKCLLLKPPLDWT